MHKFKFRIDETYLKKFRAFLWCCSDRWRYRGSPHIIKRIKSLPPLDACLVQCTMRWEFERVPLLLELGARPSTYGGCAFVMAAAAGKEQWMEKLYKLSTPNTKALESALRWAIQEKHEGIRERIEQWLG